MKIYYSLISILIAALGTSAFADEIGGRKASLTLDTAIAEAIANNPEMRVLGAAVDSARGEGVTAKTWQNPELTLAPGLKRTRDASTSTSEFHGVAELSQLFLFPGKRALLVAIAERNVELRKLAIEGLCFQLATAVRKAFYEQLAGQRIAGLRREQIKSAETFQEAAKKRVEGGYASDFEAVKSQVDVLNAKKLLRAAEGQVAAARVDLNTLMGREPGAPLQAAGTLENTGSGFSHTGALALALARNPSLRSQTMQAEVAGLNLRKTRFGNRPDFAVGPSVEYTETEQIYGISATISLPIWNPVKGEMQTATAEQQKILAEIEKTRRDIAAAVAKANAKLEVARYSLALYSPGYRDQLRSVVTQAEQSYAQSATSLLIYLDAKRTYFDTLADYYEALAAVAASRAELESAVGVPLDLSTSNPKR